MIETKNVILKQLLSQQISSSNSTSNGAIITGRNYTKIINGYEYYVIEPYLNNLALIYLLDNPTQEVVSFSKKWILWYFNNLNVGDYNDVNGSVYIHYADKSNTTHVITEPVYDSVDSYAATFLRLAYKYFQASGDSLFIKDNEYKITLIENAMLSGISSSGLSYAKPDYDIEFLMDNCEVYDGLDALVSLFGVDLINKPPAVEYYKARKQSIKKAIEAHLYNSSTKLYYPHNGASHTDMNRFYPDAVSQLFPIIFGVIEPDGDRSKQIIKGFTNWMPAWFKLEYDTYPWLLIAIAYFKVGDTIRLNEVLRSYFEKSKNLRYEGNIIHESSIALFLAGRLN